MANKIFVSYKDDYEGRIYKNLLVAWSENKNFPEISFYDNSVGTSINSTNAYYIKQVILEKIKKSDVFLCLIGEHTYKSEWVAWEIEKHYFTPTNLFGIGAKWALDFSKASILDVIN